MDALKNSPDSCILIEEDGTMKPIWPKNLQYFTLQEMYELIGCQNIEFVYPTGHSAMVIDEEGKIFQRPVNKTATIIARYTDAVYPNDCICGKAILGPLEMLGEGEE